MSVEKLNNNGLVFLRIIPEHKPKIMILAGTMIFLLVLFMLLIIDYLFDCFLEKSENNILFLSFSAFALISLGLNFLFLCWMIFGEEEIEINKHQLKYRQKLWGLRYTSKYKKSRMKNLKIQKDKFGIKDFDWSNISVQFKYGLGNKKIGKLINKEEALTIMKELKENGFGNGV